MTTLEIIRLVGHIVGFCLILAAVICLKHCISVRQMAKQRLIEVYDKLVEDNEARIDELEHNRAIYGEVKEKGFLANLDKLILYSRITDKLPWFSTVHYLFLVISATGLAFIATSILTKNLIFGLCAGMVFVVVPHLILSLFREINYKRTERQFLQFINMVAGSAQSSNDILTLLEMACFYVGDPIQTVVARTIIRARNGGDTGSCLRQLSGQLEYPLFSRFLRNLELCSRDDSDFKKIVDEFRPMAEKTIENANKIDVLYRNGRMYAFILIGLSIGMIFLAGYLVHMDMAEIISLFTDTLVGNIILVIMLIMYGVVFKLAFLRKRG